MPKITIQWSVGQPEICNINFQIIDVELTAHKSEHSLFEKLKTVKFECKYMNSLALPKFVTAPLFICVL